MPNNTPPPTGPFFTPVEHATGIRLRLLIANRDIPRGRRWKRVVTDIPSGRRYRVWQKSCGLPGCLCDAYATEITE